MSNTHDMAWLGKRNDQPSLDAQVRREVGVVTAARLELAAKLDQTTRQTNDHINNLESQARGRRGVGATMNEQMANLLDRLDQEEKARMVGDQYVEKALLQSTEQLKHGQAHADEALRTGMAQEERARLAQVSKLSDSLGSLAQNMEENIRDVRHSLETKFQECRQINEDAARRLTEFSAILDKEVSKRDTFEGALRGEITAWRRDQINEKNDIRGFVRHSVQIVETLVKQQLSDMRLCIDSEISKRVHTELPGTLTVEESLEAERNRINMMKEALEEGKTLHSELATRMHREMDTLHQEVERNAQASKITDALVSKLEAEVKAFEAETKELKIKVTGEHLRYDEDRGIVRADLTELTRQVRRVNEALNAESSERQAMLEVQMQFSKDLVSAESLDRQEQFNMHMKSVDDALTSEALERQEQFKVQTKFVNDAVSAEVSELFEQFMNSVHDVINVQASTHQEQLKAHNEEQRLNLQKELHFSNYLEVMDTHQKQGQMRRAEVESSKVLNDGESSVCTSLVSTASDWKEQLAAEMGECMAADNKFGSEIQLKVTTELKAMEALLHQHREQQTSQLLQSLTEIEEHANETVSAKTQVLLSKIEELATVFQRNLAEEVQLRNDCMTRLRDELGMHKHDTLCAIAQEEMERETEDHNLQVRLNEFQDKGDLLKADLDAMRRLWNSIEMHAHGTPIGDGLNADQRSRRLANAGPQQMAPTTVTRAGLPQQERSLSLQPRPQRRSATSPHARYRRAPSRVTQPLQFETSLDGTSPIIGTTSGGQPPQSLSHTCPQRSPATSPPPGTHTQLRSLVEEPVQFSTSVTSPSSSTRTASGSQVLMAKPPVDPNSSLGCLDRTVQGQGQLGISIQLSMPPTSGAPIDNV